MAATTGARRTVECGLEVPRGVVYQGWEPGGEYTKTLVVKNVQLRTQRIKYRIKGDLFHSAVYPRPIILSAGMSCTLPIVFKPIRKESCEESIELETSEGAVEVSLQAVLPTVLVSLPESLRFGFCAVEDSLSITFQISNTSNIGTRFSWECSNCFKISPETGDLPAKASCTLTATFSPDMATIYRETATCSYSAGRDGEMKSKTVELKGVGKYPHIVVDLLPSEDGSSSCPTSMYKKKGRGERSRIQKMAGENKLEEERNVVVGDPVIGSSKLRSGRHGSGTRREVVVNFGTVSIGTRAQRFLVLTNVSAVSATVEVVPKNHSRPSLAIFSCSESPSTIAPSLATSLPLTFTPTLPSPHPLFALFEVRIRGGLATTTVKCIGTTKAPQVVIEKEVLDFGNVPCGSSKTAVLQVRNDSDVTALFQVQLGPGSVFRVDASCSKLPPHSSRKIPVHFTPRRPIPHCKRVTCLAQHQDPLFVHFIGTVYSETVRPVILQSRHVMEYTANSESGITKLPPERLVELLKEGKLSVNNSTGHLQLTDNHSLLRPVTERDAPVLPFTNYLHSQHDQSGIDHVSVDCENLQFGCVSQHCVSDGRNLHVTNHTDGTVVCDWTTESDGVFSVVPEETEIAPGATCLFTALFRPKHDGEFYCEELECYVFYKGLRSYESVPDTASAVVTPPWCLSVRASGHSFTANTHTFTPKLVFETRDVVFPARCPLEPVYRSMTVWNDGDTPALFHLEPDPNKIFTVKPLSGLIPGGQYQTFVMEMIPQEAKTYQHITRCVINGTYTQELLLSGTAELSPVLLENQGRLFFKPTCIGTTSSATLEITNTSHLPLSYEWRMSGEGSDVVGVKSQQGTILPSQSLSSEWDFSPVEAGSLAMRAILHTVTTTAGGSTTRSSRYCTKQHKVSLDLFGLGLHGQIQCSPTSLQYGTLTMGTSHTHTITITNPTLCTIHYRLETLAVQPVNTSTEGVTLDPCEGVLHAQGSQLVRVKVKPLMTGTFTFSISCCFLSSNPAVSQDNGHTVICTLEITGAYPSLVITDIHGLEVANHAGKAELWKMFSIDRVNYLLEEDPSPSELRYAIGTRHSVRRKVSVHTHAVEDFNFGAAPLGSGQSVIHLVLENRSRVKSQWGFQFPTDMRLEPEYWADTGSLDEVERHHHDVITNQLFTVSPKTGTLCPGEKVSVLCCFKHTHIGSSRLPVLLKIHLGREILLNWSGVTLERDVPHIFFTSHHHSFTSLPIGLSSYPIQTYKLHNAGEATVTYELNTEPLQSMTTGNYSVPVLQCLAIQGEIPSRGSASLPFLFSPLEAKTYSVDVPISFSNGESVLINFSGEGVDPISLTSDPTETSQLRLSSSEPLTLPSGQMASLSMEELPLSHLPLFSPVRRLVFLTNHHSSHTLSFSWTLTSAQPAAEVVSVYPMEGCVSPNQSCVCRVTFYSQSLPSVYDYDITCRVVDGTEMKEYQLKSEKWFRTQEEKKHLFTISHPQLYTSTEKTLSLSPFRPGSSSSNSDLRGSHYPVLPPIGGGGRGGGGVGGGGGGGGGGTHSPQLKYDQWKTQDLSVKSKTRPRITKSSNEQPPEPPTPLLLHLRLTAHTHSLSDYARLYEDLDQFHIVTPAVPPATSLPSPSSGEGRRLLKMKSHERDLILSVLCEMARDILDDRSFRVALEELQQEPVPCFAQFTSRHSTTTGPDQPRTEENEYHAENFADSVGDDLKLEGGHKEEEDEEEEVEREEKLKEDVESGGSSYNKPQSDHDEGSKEEGKRTGVELLIESVLETTLLEIVGESAVGQFDITAPHFLVTQ